MRARQRTARILFLVDYASFLTSSERGPFQLADAAEAQSGLTTALWGRGWEGWDASLSAQENLKSAFPCGTLDVVYVLGDLPAGVESYCSAVEPAESPPLPGQATSSSSSSSSSAGGGTISEHAWLSEPLHTVAQPSSAQVHNCPSWRERWGAAADSTLHTVPLKWPHAELAGQLSLIDALEDPWEDSNLLTHDWHPVSKQDGDLWPGTGAKQAPASQSRPVFVVDILQPSVKMQAYQQLPSKAHVALFADAHLLVAAAAAASATSLRQQTLAMVLPCSSTCSKTTMVPWSQRKYAVTLVRSRPGPFILLPAVQEAFEAGMIKAPHRSIREMSNVMHITGYAGDRAGPPLQHHPPLSEGQSRVYSGERGAGQDARLVASRRHEYCNALAQSKLVVVEGGPWRVFPRALLDAAAVRAAVASDTPSLEHGGLLQHLVQLPTTASPQRIASAINGALRQTPQLQARAGGLSGWVRRHASCAERVSRIVDAALAFAAGRRGAMLSHSQWRGHPCSCTSLHERSPGSWEAHWSHRGCDCHDTSAADGHWCSQGYGQYAHDQLPGVLEADVSS